MIYKLVMWLDDKEIPQSEVISIFNEMAEEGYPEGFEGWALR